MDAGVSGVPASCSATAFTSQCPEAAELGLQNHILLHTEVDALARHVQRDESISSFRFTCSIRRHKSGSDTTSMPADAAWISAWLNLEPVCIWVNGWAAQRYAQRLTWGGPVKGVGGGSPHLLVLGAAAGWLTLPGVAAARATSQSDGELSWPAR